MQIFDPRTAKAMKQYSRKAVAAQMNAAAKLSSFVTKEHPTDSKQREARLQREKAAKEKAAKLKAKGVKGGKVSPIPE